MIPAIGKPLGGMARAKVGYSPEITLYILLRRIPLRSQAATVGRHVRITQSPCNVTGFRPNHRKKIILFRIS